MQTDSVWVCDLPRDGSNVVTKRDFDRNEPARKAILSGGDPKTEDLTVTAFEKYPDGPINDLPPFFKGAGGVVFSGEIAAPLLKFDLGRTLFLPLRIFRYDRKTEIFAERNYHIRLRSEVFEALAPDECAGLRPSGSETPPVRWRTFLGKRIQDEDIAVTSNALDGPAQWWDPALPDVNFFNGNVVEAMRANDTAKHWCLKRCRIVD